MEIRANKQVILDGKTINSWEEVETAYRKRMETYGTFLLFTSNLFGFNFVFKYWNRLLTAFWKMDMVKSVNSIC